MRERIEAASGSVAIKSQPGQGITVLLLVQLH
jgi:signal transduction histidine kinase